MTDTFDALNSEAALTIPISRVRALIEQTVASELEKAGSDKKAMDHALGFATWHVVKNGGFNRHSPTPEDYRTYLDWLNKTPTTALIDP